MRTFTSRTSTRNWPRASRALELSLPEATRRGLFRPLGDGDAQIARVLEELTRQGYGGWLTLEQDTMLDAAGARSPGADVARSVEFIRALDGARR